MFKESELLTLRKTELSDIDFICGLESEEENAKFIIPWSKRMHEKSIENTNILHLIVQDRNTKCPVGYIIVAGLENNNLSLEFVRITIGDKGMGYGKESFRLIKDWAFTKHNAHRLWLDVKVNNLRAFNLYKKQGFVVEGTLRECLKNGEDFESLYVMSILKSEFEGSK